MKRILLAIAIPASLLLSSCSSSDAEVKPTAAGEFASCAEAREAGAAPLLRGDAGYRTEWDRDDDGVACETDGAAKVSTSATVATAAETQDSGMFGILVPGSANNRTQQGSNTVSFDLPGMTFDEAAEWMGTHLPVDAKVNGMRPCDVQRFVGLHEWFWAGEVTASGVDMFAVSVLDTTPPSVVIKNSPSDPAGC